MAAAQDTSRVIVQEGDFIPQFLGHSSVLQSKFAPSAEVGELDVSRKCSSRTFGGSNCTWSHLTINGLSMLFPFFPPGYWHMVLPRGSWMVINAFCG